MFGELCSDRLSFSFFLVLDYQKKYGLIMNKKKIPQMPGGPFSPLSAQRFQTLCYSLTFEHRQA